MSDAFICKDQHYELITSIEQEKTFTTTQFIVSVPANVSQSSYTRRTFSFPIGGIPLWFIFESIEPASGSELYSSNVEIGEKYASLNTPYNLGTTNKYTISSGNRRYLTQTDFTFTVDSSTLSFKIEAGANVYLNQGTALSTIYNAYSDTVTVLIKYKLQS